MSIYTLKIYILYTLNFAEITVVSVPASFRPGFPIVQTWMLV